MVSPAELPYTSRHRPNPAAMRPARSVPTTDDRAPAADAGTTERFQARRGAILAAAAGQFNQRGMQGVTLADVAARVGLGKTSLNYYYRRKEDLAADCMLQAIATVHGGAQAALGRDTPAGRIRAFLCGHAQLLADMAAGRHAPLVSFNEIRVLAAPQMDGVAQAYTALFRSLRQCFPTEGWSRAQRNARTHLLLALANGMRLWVDRYEPDDYVLAADALADLLLDGMAVQPGLWQARPGPALQVPHPTHPAQDGDGAPDVREAFLRAATALVNEQGFRGASVEAISARLHLTKGSFYHHHASKDELVAQCFARSFDVVHRIQQQAMAQAATGWERLACSVRALLRFQLSEQGPLLRSSARSALDEGLRQGTLQRGEQLTARFGLFIVAGMREGSIRALDAGLAAQQVACMVNAAASLRTWVPGLGADDALALYAAPLFTGILAAPQA